LVEKLDNDRLEDLGVGGRTVFKWILKNEVGGYGLDTSGSEQGRKVGFYGHGNEPWGIIKYGCLDSWGGDLLASAAWSLLPTLFLVWILATDIPFVRG